MSLHSHGFKPMFRGFEVTEKMPLAANATRGCCPATTSANTSAPARPALGDALQRMADRAR